MQNGWIDHLNKRVELFFYFSGIYYKLKLHMKKTLLTFIGVFAILTLMAQPPIMNRRPLPNQFRDFVDFKQRMERPQIEKKDGKVIITMSEEQFKRMRQMRDAQRFRMVNHREQPMCPKCEKHHRKHERKRA